ncbi:MAG: gamma-mobile-trio protein GmtX [Thermaerobacter sp.]|nr:gamma-mobile-trio protein GmtX [Thermaerobacter sp.]
MHPDQILEQLKATANTRKQKNLDLIHAVCREQYERGSRDFSVATIARIAHERGGPTKGSIHNKTGDDFKAIIKAWAEHTGGVTRKERRVSENPYMALIERIDNPAVRSVMASLLAENQKMRRQINLLKANAGVVIDMRQQEITSQQESIQILPALPGLTDSEKEALRLAISEKFLKDEGWSCDERGRIINDKGREIFKVGFATAIRKILGTMSIG